MGLDHDEIGFGASVDQPFGARDDRPGLLILADDIYLDDAAMLSRAAGLRLLGTVPLDLASTRLDVQIGCDIILCFCPTPDAMIERLLVQIETLALQNDMPVILVADLETVDLAYACLRSERTQLLCRPGHTDLAAALLAAARQTTSGAFHEANRDNEGLRLQQLSDEVSRLARTLEALTLRPRHATPSFDLGPRISDEPNDYIGMPSLEPIGSADKAADAAAVDAAQVRDLLRARRLRDDFLPADLFADPAWDMLLDLLAARLEHERVSVSSLCIASAVPPTTALRWIRTLTEKGFVDRQADPHDGRRVFIALADHTTEALSRWFTASRRFLCA
ncbi:regulatory protein MarR [Sphingobium chlorophenolicum L-1]|uniref:Regulatory protein MarR n=1 Tax=Sphingobium chlorophenolicum L-1 TaxID=690566 RepID=F6EUE3_SPHCR|nr:MarR family transcriptional regulator [Sphingobium chlorophenolicum]AEG49596.1 regulatory protein MarR [Sphingobium chlorophenolicum L-1]